MRLSAFLGGLAAVVVGALASGNAIAAFGDFQYGTSVTPKVINGSGSDLLQAGVGMFPNPAGPPNYNAALLPQGTNITVGSLIVEDMGTSSPYTDPYSVPITVDLNIRDLASGLVGGFSFAGTLSGTVASNGTIDAFFNNPFTAVSISKQIGNTIYDVSIIPSTSFSAPGTPGAPPPGQDGTPGAYVFDVHATPAPEPSGLMLFAGLAVVGIRRRA